MTDDGTVTPQMSVLESGPGQQEDLLELRRALDAMNFRPALGPNSPLNDVAGTIDPSTHKEMCKNYREMLRHNRTFIDDEREQAYIAECQEAELQGKDKPSPKTERGARKFIEKQGPGQTVMQMLQVRGEIRYTGWLNSLRRQEMFEGLQSGTPQHQRARIEYFNATCADFINRMRCSHPQLMPKVVTQLRTDIDSLYEALPPFARIHQEMSPFGDMIVDLTTMLDSYSRPGHAFQLYMLSRITSNAGMEFAEPTIALLVPGPKSAGKTRGFDIIRKCSPPAMHKMLSYRTAKSSLTHHDCDMVNTIVDEATSDLIGMEDGPGSNDAAAILKTTMTMPGKVAMVNYCDMSEDGLRTPGIAVSSQTGTLLVATNIELKNRKESPVLARYIVKEATIVPAELPDAIESRMISAEIETEEEKRKKKKAQNVMIFDTYTLILVECAIACGVIDNVELAPLEVYRQMLQSTLGPFKMHLADPKRVNHLKKVVRTLTIMTACFYAFRSPATTEARANKTFWEYVPEALRTVERLLVPDLEICMFAFSLLEFLWIDEQTERISSTLSRMCDAQRFLNLDNSAAAGGSTMLQAEMSAERMHLNNAARSGNNSNVQQSRAPRASGLPKFNDVPMIEQDGKISKEERNLRMLMRSDAVPQMHLPFKENSNNISINAQWVLVGKLPFRSITTLAQEIRADTSKDEVSSIENIKSALKTMLNTRIESHVYQYNAQTNRIVQSNEGMISQMAMMSIDTTDKRAYHGSAASMTGGQGKMYYIATEVITNPQMFHSVFTSALGNMSFRNTQERDDVMTAFPCRHFEYKNGDRFAGKRVEFHGVYQTVNIRPDVTKAFCITNRKKVSRGRADIFDGKLGGPEAAPSEESQASQLSHSTTRRFTQDPDFVYASKRAAILGCDVKQCCWLFAYCDAPEPEEPSLIYPDDLVMSEQIRRYEHQRAIYTMQKPTGEIENGATEQLYREVISRKRRRRPTLQNAKRRRMLDSLGVKNDQALDAFKRGYRAYNDQRTAVQLQRAKEKNKRNFFAMLNMPEQEQIAAAPERQEASSSSTQERLMF